MNGMRMMTARWIAAAVAMWLGISSAQAIETGNLSEVWDAAYIGGQKVGYVHSVTDRRDAAGQLIVHMRQTTVFTIARFNDVMKLKMTSDSYETSNGSLYAIDSRLQMANQEQRTVGRLGNDNIFTITVQTTGKNESQTIPWDNDVVGPYAPERMLREKPLQPGDKRSFKTFLPELNSIVIASLVAIRKEATEMRDGSKKELLLVEQSFDKLPIKLSLWFDQDGTAVKGLLPMAGMTVTTFRVTQKEAMDEPVGANVDLGYRTLVKPSDPLRNPHQRNSATYRLEMEDAIAADTIPAAGYQKIIGRDKNVVRIEVRRETPPPGSAAGPEEPTSEFLISNAFIQSDNPKIMATARDVVGTATDPWQKVQRLEKWVDGNMQRRDFNIGFATAGEVIDTRHGDCTEHSVLLAALCRAVGVPARVAMGLVYVESIGAFGYHMWTEVKVGGQWYAVDGTLGLGSIGAGHIKIADSSLKGVSAMSTLLPILNVIGKLKIVVEKQE